MYRRESKPLISSEESDGNHDWSSGDSSVYSGTESSDPEWQDDVLPDGELIYIKLKSEEKKADETNEQNENAFKLRNNFKRLSTRRVSRGKFFKTRKKAQISKRSAITETDAGAFLSKTKDILIEIPLRKIFQSSKSDRLEELFGITTTKYSTSKDLIVDSVNSEARHLYPIKMTMYCLKEIDNNHVNSSNIDSILDQIRVDNRKHLLKFTVKNVASDLNLDIKHLVTSKREHDHVLAQILRDCCAAVVYITNEDNIDGKDVLYCYPSPEKQNFLYNIRGAFITLNNLVTKLPGGKPPITTSIIINDSLNNVFYYEKDNDLLLMSFPERLINRSCGIYLVKMFAKLLEFQYGSLKKCFSDKSHTDKLDFLFSRAFSMFLCGFGHESISVRMEDLITRNSHENVWFEQLLSLPHAVTLPREAKLQIDDSLYELEAGDYREWSDDPLNDQRLYVVIGCSLFYAGHLLSSHMMDEDLRDVHAFLMINGLLALSNQHYLDKLVIWKEVFVNANRNRNNNSGEKYRIPDGRWFLLIVGKGKFLLATLMEAGGCTEEATGRTPPAPFYVEECECCLEILFDVELDKFLEGWSMVNATPQIQLKPETLGGKSGKSDSGKDTLDRNLTLKLKTENKESKRRHHSIEQINTVNQEINTTHNLGNQLSQSTLNCSQSTSNFSQPAKQRSNQKMSNDQNIYGQWYSGGRKAYSVGNNLNVAYNEDSTSQNSNSENRTLSRKNGRSRNRIDSSSSESDWDNQEGSRASSSLDPSDIRRTIMDEINEITAKRITSGDRNVLFHFVELDFQKGVFLAPMKDLEANNESALYAYIMKSFRIASLQIHNVLQETVRFKEETKSTSQSSGVNKSFVAVKEYGILLEAPASIFEQLGLSKRRQASYQFWVVGFEKIKQEVLFLLASAAEEDPLTLLLVGADTHFINKMVAFIVFYNTCDLLEII